MTIKTCPDKRSVTLWLPTNHHSSRVKLTSIDVENNIDSHLISCMVVVESR
jgi:hypothetical protein